MKDLILHSLSMHKVQTASVMLSVAISVMALFALALTFGGVQTGVEVNAQRNGAQMLVVPRDAAAEISEGDLLFTGAPAPFYFDASAEDRIAGIEGVTRTSAQFFGQTLDESCCSVDAASRLMGVDFATDWTVAPFAHIDLADGLGDDAVVVGSGAAGTVGSFVTILDKVYTVADRLEPTGSELDHSIIMDIDVARKAVAGSSGLSYLWDKWGQPDGLVSCVLVDYAADAATDRVVNRITSTGDLRVIERSVVVAQSQGRLEAVFAVLLGAGVLMLVSTMVQLFARFYSCVWDRKSELALYRAIGADKSQLRMIIGGEVAVIAGVGVAAGLVLGAVLYRVLLGMLQSSAAFPFVELSVPAQALIALGIVTAFAVLAIAAIAAPLSQLGRLEPSLAMQQGDID